MMTANPTLILKDFAHRKERFRIILPTLCKKSFSKENGIIIGVMAKGMPYGCLRFIKKRFSITFIFYITT